MWGLIKKITVVLGSAGDEEVFAEIHAVAESLGDCPVGPARQGGVDGVSQQPAVMLQIVLVNEHDTIVALCNYSK